MVLTDSQKGVCLIAVGIIMRGTNCSAEEVQTLHGDRYRKLIAKKGKTTGITEADAEVLSSLSINELVA